MHFREGRGLVAALFGLPHSAGSPEAAQEKILQIIQI
jgi:hypothetical protein